MLYKLQLVLVVPVSHPQVFNLHFWISFISSIVRELLLGYATTTSEFLDELSDPINLRMLMTESITNNL
jgi:hypothetical protein